VADSHPAFPARQTAIGNALVTFTAGGNRNRENNRSGNQELQLRQFRMNFFLHYFYFFLSMSSKHHCSDPEIEEQRKEIGEGECNWSRRDLGIELQPMQR
jgi:hypothetical protein